MYFSNSQAIRVLPTPGVPADDDQRRSLRLLAGVEELLEDPQLAVPPHQWGLEPVRALGTPDGRHHGAHRPQRRRLVLATKQVAAHVDVRDRRCREQPGRLVDPHLTGCRDTLHPGRGVHRVTGDHALLLRADRHRDLARDDADAHRQPGDSQLLAERGDAAHQLQTGSHRALGVVLVRGRHAPHRHHGVADELLHGSAVPADDSPALLEVGRLQVPHVLLVATLAEAREADQVPEEDAGHASCDRRPRRRRCRRVDRTGRCAAREAEPGAWHQLLAAGGAVGRSLGGAAREAEPGTFRQRLAAADASGHGLILTPRAAPRLCSRPLASRLGAR